MAYENDGSWCAIQCKCYKDDGTLDYKTLSTFFLTISRIKKRHKRKVNAILVYTGDRITPNADNTIQENHCHVIGQDEFRDSSIIWDGFPKLVARKPKQLRRHQTAAFNDVVKKLESADRGKLIMACGTGKTLTALHIAEKHAGAGKTVLYLVPSLSLIHQTMREWSENSQIKHHYAVVCSDITAGEDEDGDISQLAFPPTTNVKELQKSFGKRPDTAMGVVFSTYQSIQVAAQALKGKPFDLVLCDEAHRTAGAEKEQRENPAQFTLVHHNRHVPAKKRLYMTATPRIYGKAVKDKANVSSMDDASIFGEELHYYSFDNAVNDGQLSDYKVRVPVISEDDLAQYMTEGVDDADNENITIDERVLLAAVWHALNYDRKERQPLLQRVIAFSNRVQGSKQFAGAYRGEAPTQDEETYLKNIKKNEDDDRIVADRSFASTVQQFEKISKDRTGNIVSVRHVDGAMRANVRNNKMRWLKDSGNDERECRILSNARCLSEGVDVPALDAVVFLHPRRSKTDVIQSVGRVMRKADGKEYGYVILPVVVPSGMTFERSLQDHKQWEIVWQVLRALRSHNPNFANEINRINLDRPPINGDGPHPTGHVEIIYMGSFSRLAGDHEMFGKLTTKMVENVGDRLYYDDQAKELGRKAREIRNVLANVYEKGSSSKLTAVVDKLCGGLRVIIHDSIRTEDAITVLAQHYSLSRIFNALFPKEFRSANNVAAALDEAISAIGLKAELKTFDKFYAGVEKEVFELKSGGKQAYIKKIYGNFLAGFDKKSTEKEGIVYTPNEVIDFIIHSVEHVLRTEFSTGFGCRDVKVFDPFAGTGAFITRLLESGLIRKDRLHDRYRNDIWANEINLLAYYVASVNIESVFAKASGADKHVPFRNINYTDTLNHHPMYRQDAEHRQRQENIVGRWKNIHEDIEREQWSHIHVIIGNPPYSGKQKNFSDQNQNISYPMLDEQITKTYLEKLRKIKEKNNEKTGATNSLRDSYVRAIRWASDRIGESGVIGLITNASFLRSNATAGVRACLAEEFSEVWCFNLRGNQRTQGEISRQEGGKIFGSGSKTPTAITILVKNPKMKSCVIRYKDIGDYHSREEKLKIIRKSGSISGIKDWQIINPDKHHDWIKQRTDNFSKYLLMGSKNKKADTHTIFNLYSNGVKTRRDTWVYNSSKDILSKNMRRHIEYCMEQDPSNPVIDPTRGAWTERLEKHHVTKFNKEQIRISQYRAFFKQYLYLDKVLTYEWAQIPQFFPESGSKNIVMIVPDKHDKKFSTFVSDVTPDVQIIQNCQCFALYRYKNNEREYNITDSALKQFHEFYQNEKITKPDVFYYVYGMLHHPGYRIKYANNLMRELPRIPMAPDFKTFKNIGKRLANLHLNFETCPRYDLGKPLYSPSGFRKLTFKQIKNTKTSKKESNGTKIMIDGNLTFENIPEVKYQVNGRTPLEWIVDRYRITQDKESGIINDPCTGVDIIAVIERAVYVGVESDKIISRLPKEFEPPEDWTPSKSGLEKFMSGLVFQSKL